MICYVQQRFFTEALFASEEEKERFIRSIPADEKGVDAYLDLHAAMLALPKKLLQAHPSEQSGAVSLYHRGRRVCEHGLRRRLGCIQRL